jgi:hypothetical protein
MSGAGVFLHAQPGAGLSRRSPGGPRADPVRPGVIRVGRG